MVLDHRTQYLTKVRSFFTVVVAPLQYVVSTPIHLVNNITLSVASRQALLKENSRLKTQQLLWQAKLQTLTALQNENEQLRALLSSAAKASMERIVIAQLLAVATEPLLSEVVVDKGQHADVYVGQAVLDAKGIVGQVIQVGPLTSRVMLITDMRSAVPVQDARNGVRGIVAGQGGLTNLSLIDVPPTADIKNGDLLVSSGLGGHYPAGYPVGVVNKVKQNMGEQTETIEVEPIAQLDRNQYVLLLWQPKPTVVDVPQATTAVKPSTKVKKAAKTKGRQK